MSPRTFKSCPDIHILPGHSYFAWTFGFYRNLNVCLDIQILPGHSGFYRFWMSARTFKFCPDIQVLYILNFNSFRMSPRTFGFCKFWMSARTFNFNSYWMSPQTFAFCPDIRFWIIRTECVQFYLNVSIKCITSQILSFHFYYLLHLLVYENNQMTSSMLLVWKKI